MSTTAGDLDLRPTLIECLHSAEMVATVALGAETVLVGVIHAPAQNNRKGIKMNVTTLQALLLQSAASQLPTLQVGLLTQLYSPNEFGLRSDAHKVLSPLRVHREFGHPRRSVPESLRALGDAGFIEMDVVSGEQKERFSPTVRLLSDAEIATFLGLGAGHVPLSGGVSQHRAGQWF